MPGYIEGESAVLKIFSWYIGLFISKDNEEARMLSKRYVYRSTHLRDRYAEGAIDYEHYMQSLEKAKDEELGLLITDYEKRQRLQEIYDFELQQFSWAEQTRKNNEEAHAARIRE